jgi:hypothetical protein
MDEAAPQLRAVAETDGDGDNVKRLDAWLAARPKRTHEVDAIGRHVLRERGILMARNLDLGLGLDTAEATR